MEKYDIIKASDIKALSKLSENVLPFNWNPVPVSLPGNFFQTVPAEGASLLNYSWPIFYVNGKYTTLCWDAGDGSYIVFAESEDAITWARSGYYQIPLASDGARRVLHVDGYYVVLTGDGKIIRSTNPESQSSWELFADVERWLDSAGVGVRWHYTRNFIYGNGVYLIQVRKSSGTGDCFLCSSDGVNWTVSTFSTGTVQLESSTGIVTASGALIDDLYMDVTFNEEFRDTSAAFVAIAKVKIDEKYDFPERYCIFRSVDGKNFTAICSPTSSWFTQNSPTKIIGKGSTLIVIFGGSDIANNGIAYITNWNATRFRSQQIPFSKLSAFQGNTNITEIYAASTAFGYFNGKFVAPCYGRDAQLKTYIGFLISPDGFNWDITFIDTYYYSSSYPNFFGYAGNRFLAAYQTNHLYTCYA